MKRAHLTLAHWTQVSDRCPMGYLSIIEVHLIDINVYAKFDEFPSLSFQDINPLFAKWTILAPPIYSVECRMDHFGPNFKRSGRVDLQKRDTYIWHFYEEKLF